MTTPAHFQLAYNMALNAGRAAAINATPTPMVVVGGGQRYFVADGVCGFAWVNVKPGTSRFAKWLVSEKLARKSYSGGVDIWISDYDQSMQRKEAHAHAMANSLQQEFLELKINGQSRMD